MNEAEKERLIKKDLVSIENRVRHAFNQGYEMGLKECRSENPNTCEREGGRMKIDLENCHKCIHSSVCTWYGAEYCDWYVDTCGDAISRQAAIKAIEALQRPIMREESNYYQFKFSGMSEALGAVENLPSVTPQQKTGRWISTDVLDKIRTEIERKAHSGQWSDATMYGMLKAVAIIDKYKAESEDKDADSN